MPVLDPSHLEPLANLLRLHQFASGFPKLKQLADTAMKDIEEYAASLEKILNPPAEPEPASEDAEWKEPEVGEHGS